MKLNHTTLAHPVRLSGTGLFSAQPSTLTISPTTTGDSGIFFVHNATQIPAHIDHLSTLPVHPAFAQMSPRCTSVGSGAINIATIEHVLSALIGVGITDAKIEVESDHDHTEIPIMDGSSLDFVNAIISAGTKTLDPSIAPTEPITISKPILIEQNGSSIIIEPANSLSYTYTLEYNYPSIADTTVSWQGDPDEYIRTIAPARTFCLEHEAQAMHAAGMFTHLTPKDMLVIGDNGPIENTLRHKHECAYHKLLDLIGDLSLVGRPMIAKVTAIKSGHGMAHRAARAIVDQNS